MWDGVFNPYLRKQIGGVRFVSLVEMTEKDWQILEYENLRSVAKNRLAGMIEKKQLIGFFHVNVVMKAKQKPDYYWPASEELFRRFQENQNHDFFRHQADVEFDSDATARVDRLIGMLRILSPTTLTDLVDWMIVRYDGDAAIQQLEAKRGELSSSSFYLLMITLLYRHLTFTEIETLLESL